jgi:class 3 adenylate cyclase
MAEQGVGAAVERKIVTVLFCDLVGSTALGERLDPEVLKRVEDAYFDRMRSLVERHGGTVEKFIGDAVVAVFGVPRVHEDDAERAVRCALAMRAALEGLNDSLRPNLGVELSLRIGIDTGEAVTAAPADQAIAMGDVTNTAARVEQAAKPGEVLVGRGTFLLTERVIDYVGHPPVVAKGKARPVAVWTARGVSAGRRRPRSPLAGRHAELEALAVALEEAIVSGEPQVALVLGEPGIGKSRLFEEFAARAEGRAQVLRGAALPYGEGTAWRPADVVRAEAGILEGDPPEVALPRLAERLAERHPLEEATLIEAQIGPLLGATRASGTSGPEILWALGRYLEGLAREAPVVILLDDLQWADRILLDTFQGLVEAIGSGPVVMVILGRPELGERLGGLGERSQVLVLKPLRERDAMALLSYLQTSIGRDWSEGQEREIVRRAEGNPLFLEEIGAIFADTGSLERPRSLHALIAARIDLSCPVRRNELPKPAR